MDDERWMPIPGFPDYEVSDFGRVRSIAHVQMFQRRTRNGFCTVSYPRKGVILQPGTVRSGHKIVVLGRRNPKLVHALVLRAFVGPPPKGHEALHWDGKSGNNYLTNLRWGTRTENVEDARRHGKMPLGDTHARSILRSADIPTIRDLMKSNTQREIAEMYGVHRSTILNIRLGKTWKHVA